MTVTRDRWLFLATCALLVAGLFATVRGMRALGGLATLPWEYPGLVRLLLVLLASALSLLATARWLRLSAVPAAAVTIVVALVLLGALWPVLVIAALALASALVGRRLRRWWRDSQPDPDGLLDVVIGAGVYASLIGVLAHWPVAHSALYSLLIALPIAADRHSALKVLRACVAAARDARAPLAAWPAASLAVVYTIVALFPEPGWDALAMHLTIPGHLAAQGRWGFDPDRFAWALMPMLGDWLFAIVYLFDGERGVRLLNAGCALIVAIFIHRLAVAGGATRNWAWFGASLWLATPVAFAIAACAFIDAEWTMFVLAGVYLLLRPGVPGQPAYAWITAALLLGFAASAKAVTLPLMPAIVLMALTRVDAWHARGTAKVLMWATLAFILGACKPYLTAWWLTGNPVYPFFGNLFGGLPLDLWSGSGPQRFRAPLSWRTIYDATFATDRYLESRMGGPGFQWLLLFPAAALALLATWHRRGLVLLAGGVLMVVAVFAFQGYLRYILPALALLVAAIAVGGTLLSERAPAAGLALGAAGAVALAMNVAYLNAASSFPSFPVETVWSERARRAHVEERLPIVRAAEVAASLPADGGRIALFSQPVFATIPASDVVSMSWYSPPFLRAVRKTATPEALARTLLDWNVRYVLTDNAFGEADVRLRLEAATVPLVDFEGASVRVVRREFLFEHEYVRDGGFDAATAWTLVGAARHDADRKVVVVTAASPAYQFVNVVGGDTYRNTVRARCAGAGVARAQVNWVDASMKGISTSLHVFGCGEQWTEKVQDVVAPRNAVGAVVYATGDAATPVEIGAVSLRGRKR